MECEYVTDNFVLSTKLSANNIEDLKYQFKIILKEANTLKGIVYCFEAEKNIPRLKGDSNVIYIGKTSRSLDQRYSGSNLNHEIEHFGLRYIHIIGNYGNISIRIYKTSKPEDTENKFIYQYHCQHLELPPINLRSYQRKYI